MVRRRGGRVGGDLPEAMVPDRLSASRKRKRRQNSLNKMAESLQAMLPKDMVHTPLLVSRNSKKMQSSLNEKAKLPEAMVSKRLLASCSLVLLDLGRPTAAHCDCSSTYTQQPQLLSLMWT